MNCQTLLAIASYLSPFVTRYYMASKTLPSSITSYDILKTFAVLTMIIDHIGLYFFPDEMWWRVIGRLSFPVWLFLIGYAQSRDIPKLLILGA